MIVDRTIAPPSRPIREVHFIEAQTQHLSNGVPVHVIRAGKQPVVRIELVFRNAGVKHETKVGACFFTIKMLAEGTPGKSAYEISEYVDKFGAFLQLSPGVDYSSVDIYCLNKYADELLSLLREIITEASFPEEELAKFKTIQRQRLRVSNERSSVLASKKMKAVLFGAEHPYGRSMEEEDIDSITRSDLLAFYQNALLSGLEIIISGDVTEEALGGVEKYFGQDSLTPETAGEKIKTPLLPAENKQLIVERPENLQSSIRMGMQLFTKDHPDYHKMQVVNTLLGGYFGSRLMRNIREEKGLTYGINSGIIMHQEAGYFIIGTDVKKEFTGLVMEEIYSEINQLWEKPVDEVELNIIKNYMAGRLLSSVDTPFALADKFKNIYLYGLDYGFYKKYLDVINTIDADTIRQTVVKHLISSGIKEVVVGGYS